MKEIFVGLLWISVLIIVYDDRMIEEKKPQESHAAI